MADSTVSDISKLKVVELRKELKSRGLPSTGDKAELVTRLQTAMSQDEHGDIMLDSDEIDSDGVLEDEDDKSQGDLLDDSAVDTINEELALAEQPAKPTPEPKPSRVLKRKLTAETTKKAEGDGTEEKEAPKKIVLNRATSITTTKLEEKTDSADTPPTESTKVKITADVDPKTRLELRAKRFGLPVKMSDAERKEARMKRFGQNTSNSSTTSTVTGSLSENLDKLKQRSERFGQSVSKIMTDIENKERLEKRKAKFGAT